MSVDKRQYDVFKGLLSGKQVNTLESQYLLKSIQGKVVSALESSPYTYVLHDPCDIRKPSSSGLEHLGRVLNLSKQVVNGYRSMNSAAVDINDRSVHLLYHQLYSNAQPNYLSQSSIDNIEQEERSKQLLFQSGGYINTSILYRQALQEAHQVLQERDKQGLICHVSDREFDNQAHFEYIDGLGDHFITRLKLSRLSNERKTTYTPKGKISKKKVFKKLVDKQFAHQARYRIDCLTIKSKTYHKVDCLLEWEELILNEKTYSVLRISLSQAGKAIFKHPMLLLTNQAIHTQEQAKQVYKGYLLRFKIEVVFRFTKQNLGWETFQVRDFESIKNLLAIAFFLVGFFKELQEELEKHPLSTFLCQLALSKGKITPFFLLKGLERLVHFQQVAQWMKEYDISHEEVDEFIRQFKE
jgi:hypothetical protein